MSNNKEVKGPFKFSSNVIKKKRSLNIKTFGDHDLKKGQEVIKRLEKEKYDLLILLGDYSYNMDDENGKWGVVEFDQDIEKPMPAGNYKAHISKITIADKTDNYWMIIEFEIIEHDEFLGCQPDPYFYLLGSRLEGKKREVKKGRKKI